MDAQAASLREAMSVLPVGYQHLLDRAIDVLGADPRVEAMWVHGSVARGDADALSDLDIIVAVADDDLTGFGDEWRARLDAITPTVMARRFPGPGGSLLSITPECLRMDMWIEGAADVPHVGGPRPARGVRPRRPRRARSAAAATGRPVGREVRRVARMGRRVSRGGAGRRPAARHRGRPHPPVDPVRGVRRDQPAAPGVGAQTVERQAHSGPTRNPRDPADRRRTRGHHGRARRGARCAHRTASRT